MTRKIFAELNRCILAACQFRASLQALHRSSHVILAQRQYGLRSQQLRFFCFSSSSSWTSFVVCGIRVSASTGPKASTLQNWAKCPIGFTRLEK